MSGQGLSPIPCTAAPHVSEGNVQVIIQGADLRIPDVVRVAREHSPRQISGVSGAPPDESRRIREPKNFFNSRDRSAAERFATADQTFS